MGASHPSTPLDTAMWHFTCLGLLGVPAFAAASAILNMAAPASFQTCLCLNALWQPLQLLCLHDITCVPSYVHVPSLPLLTAMLLCLHNVPLTCPKLSWATGWTHLTYNFLGVCVCGPFYEQIPVYFVRIYFCHVNRPEVSQPLMVTGPCR